ncbi:XRE family transcriptional regulator [Lactococcus petauri]|uniref:XRE family transcriptional regulator n=1 Tax=Lactococcus petauri TaxID=1940789 RepID=UPI003852D220
MEFHQRLKDLRTESGYTQKQIAEMLNIKQPPYQRWESGANKPRADKLEELAKIFNVSISYLLGETDIKSGTKINRIMEKLSEKGQNETIDFARKKLIDETNNNKLIELKKTLIPYKVEEEQALSAGNGEGYTSSQNKEIVYWDKDVDYDRAIWIKGDSMEPDFHYGEVALVKYQTCYDYPGQICAVDDVERGQAYIKSVRVIDDFLVLHSLNDSVDDYGNLIFPDKYIPLSDNPRIVGKIVDHFIPIENN